MGGRKTRLSCQAVSLGWERRVDRKKRWRNSGRHTKAIMENTNGFDATKKMAKRMCSNRPYRVVRSSKRYLLAALLCAIAMQPVYAQTAGKVFSKAGSWVITKIAPHQCVAYTTWPGDVVTLEADRSGLYLVLSNWKFEIPPGSFPVGLKMIGYSVTRSSKVVAGFPHAIGVPLTADDLRVFLRATWVEFDLGPHWHFLNLTGNEAVMRMLPVCESNETDPFATAK